MAKSLFNNGEDKLIIYTDGGSRGNPGPSAIGVVVGGKEYCEQIGKATNNVAEYQAVIFALKKTRQILGGKKSIETEIEIRTDSELIQRQLSGKYRIKEEDLKILFVNVHNLLFDFKKVSFKHIPREENRRADFLVNKALDGK